MPCSSVGRYQCFRSAWRWFLWNNGTYLRTTKCHMPQNYNLNTHCCENLMSQTSELITVSHVTYTHTPVACTHSQTEWDISQLHFNSSLCHHIRTTDNILNTLQQSIFKDGCKDCYWIIKIENNKAQRQSFAIMIMSQCCMVSILTVLLNKLKDRRTMGSNTGQLFLFSSAVL